MFTGLNKKGKEMKKTYFTAIIIFFFSLLLTSCDFSKCPIHETPKTELAGCIDCMLEKQYPELKTERLIKEYVLKTCLAKHVERHSYDAKKYIERNPAGFSMPAIGLYANPERVAAENYVGSDLHTHLRDDLHVNCIAEYANTFKQYYYFSGEIQHDKDDNHKVISIKISKLTVKTGFPVDNFQQYVSFSAAKPSEKSYTTKFEINRKFMEW